MGDISTFRDSGGWNDGREDLKVKMGKASETIRTDFGLDRSSARGAMDAERTVNFAGSNSDLSHSLSGTSAQQSEDKRGKQSSIDEA